MRAVPHEIAIMILADDLPDFDRESCLAYFGGREGAHKLLVKLTGQDFGYDADKWREWFKQHPAGR